MIEMTIPIAPHAKGRPRAGRGQVYTPESTRAWSAQFAMLAAQHRPAEPLEGPLRVDVLAIRARPVAMRTRAFVGGLVWCPRRPDRDNVDKAVLDAMAAWWHDDAQVCLGVVAKAYAELDGVPRVCVRVSELHGEAPEQAWSRLTAARPHGGADGD